MTKHIQWDGTLSQEGFDILKGEGGCIVCPTKVGLHHHDQRQGWLGTQV